MIPRRNTGHSITVNPSAKFVSLVKTVNPQNEYIVKPAFKAPKPRAGFSLEINEPPKPKNITPFSKNF
tara:strand:- start:5522 stop:5725 length:204 start_codon:yes stop_codon:yes gene_type:complete